MKENEAKIQTISYNQKEFHMYLPSQEDHVQAIIRRTGTFYEKEMLEFIQKVSKPGTLALDVGANIGNHSVFLAGVCQLHVVAFEPEDACFEILKKNLELNNLKDWVDASNKAVGANLGRGCSVIVDSKNMGANRFQETKDGPIEVVTLDSVEFADQVSIIKIDVEGMEIDVLKGATRILSEDRPILFLEAREADDFSALKEFLLPFDYRPLEAFNWTDTWLFMPDKTEAEQYNALLAQIGSTGTHLLFESQNSVEASLKEFSQSIKDKINYITEQQGWQEERTKKLQESLLEVLKNSQDQAQRIGSIAGLVHGLECAQEKSTEIFKSRFDYTKEQHGWQEERAKRLQDNVLEVFKYSQEQTRLLSEVSGFLKALEVFQQKSMEVLSTRFDSVKEHLIWQDEGVQKIHQALSELKKNAEEQFNKYESIEEKLLAFKQQIQLTNDSFESHNKKTNETIDSLVEKQQETIGCFTKLQSLQEETIEYQQENQKEFVSVGQDVEDNKKLLNSILDEIEKLKVYQRDQLDSIASEQHSSAKQLKYIEKQNEYGENRTRLEAERLRTSLRELKKDLKEQGQKDLIDLQNKLHRTQKELNSVRDSMAYRIGAAIVDIKQHPVGGTLRIPGRIYRTIRVKMGLPPRHSTKHKTVQPKQISQPLNFDKQSPYEPQQQKELRSKNVASQSETGLQVSKGVVFHDMVSVDHWSGWEANLGAAIKSDGELSCIRSGGLLGAVKKGVLVEPGRYYRLRLSGKIDVGEAEIFWIVRDSTSSKELTYFNDNQVAIIPLRGLFTADSPATLIFRTFQNTLNLDLYLVLRKISQGESVFIDHIIMEPISFEEACPLPRLNEDELIIASIASIPKRKTILEDVVNSLYHQVDEIRVFLNGYDEIPSYLKNDNKIMVATSQEWGDNGDAGKFFWAEDPTPGYRFICDDDIIYPPNYVYEMVKFLKSYNNKIVVGLHGILLKQPLSSYYDVNYRNVRACWNHNDKNFACNVLGTGVLAYYTSSFKLSSTDFHFRNMADIWFAKNALEQNIPLVCVARPDNWVMPQEVSDSSIFSHSTSDLTTSMNTAILQSHVIRSLYPLSLTRMSESRKKVVFSVKTYNRQDYLKDCIESFLKTRSEEYDWVVIVADDGSTDDTLMYLEQLRIPHEFHIIRNKRRYAVGQTNTIFELCEKIGFDICFCVDDDLVFTKPGWDHIYINAIGKSGYSHLVHRHLQHCINLKRRNEPEYELPTPVYDKTGLCVAYGDAHFDWGTGSLFTVTADTLKRAGYCDEANFPIRGQWHVDYHIRCCRAGANDKDNLFDVVDSNEYIEIQNYLNEEYRCAIPWNDDYKKTKEPAELERRYKVMADTSRIYVEPLQHKSEVNRGSTINTFFDKVYVLNLARRPDRWERIQRSAKHFGIELSRYSAADGKQSPYSNEYEAYCKQPRVQVPEQMRINSSFAYYRNYTSDVARIAYFEQNNERKAIGSPGAWGYLKTMIGIIEDAIQNEYEQILVLDDDVLFHKEFNERFSHILSQVPDDWKILQLGALQYHWDDKWITWFSENLYSCHGSSVGSHAVGMRRNVMPLVLNHCYKLDLPYDEGPLHKPKYLFPEKCLTFYPNLLIQDVTESDISNETGQKKVMKSKDNVYKWNMDEYLKD